MACVGAFTAIAGPEKESQSDDSVAFSAKQAQASRQQFAATLQGKLDGATTSAQKQSAVDEYRAAMESQMQQVAVPTEPEVAPAVLIGRMKASAGNDAQQLAQVARLEKNFQEQAEFQTKLAAINEAQGAVKQQLVDEFRAAQETKLKEQEAELAQSGVALADADDEQTAQRSPELDARLAKVKKQQEDFDKTMAAVEQASSPAEKARLIDAWRAQMEAEMAARAAELQHLEVP